MKRDKKIVKKNSDKAEKKDKELDPASSKSKFEISEGLIKQAFEILKSNNEISQGKSKSLFEISRNPFLYVSILVNTLPKSHSIKPSRVPLPISIYGKDFNTKQLFIVSNEFKNENKTLLKQFKGDWKFVSYDKIAKNFHEYKDKLSLLKDFDIFFCEGSIYMSLKKHLGKYFYEQKKYPFPVDFKEHNGYPNFNSQTFEELLKNLIENSAYFYQGNGPEYSIKIARFSDKGDSKFSASTIKKSVINFIKELNDRSIKLNHIRRISLKSEKSDSFPIYSYLSPSELDILEQLNDN